MSSLLKVKDCPVERVGKDLYQLKGGEHKNRWLDGTGRICDDKGTITGKHDAEDDD